MRKLLRKLHLIDTLTINLKLSKQEFAEKLSAITQKGSTSMFKEPFEALNSDEFEFKGQINFDQFKIRRHRRFFDQYYDVAIARGTVVENNEKVTIKTEINGFSSYSIFYYFILFVAFIIILIAIINSRDFSGILFVLFFGLLMFLLPYFAMRISVKRLKHQLEREFFYLTKNE